MREATSPDIDDTALPERRSNRPVTFGHYIEYALARFLIAFFRVVGVDLASFISGKVLRILGPLLRGYSRRAEENLRRAFPDWNDRQIKNTTAEVWENLGRTAAEYAHLDRLSIHGDNARILHQGFDKLRLPEGGYQQVIFVTGHFANWETPAVCARQLGINFGIIYRAANNPLVDELIIHKRADTMTRHQTPKGRRGARGLIGILSKGLSVAMLVDQKLNDGIAVPFMGRDAMTAPAAARMAFKFNVPVIPVTCERLNGARFLVTAHEQIPYAATDDKAADVYDLTKKINEALERQVTAHPGQWLWLHRRWPKEN